MTHSRLAPAALLVSTVLLASVRADAQPGPCCAIVSIDANAGVASAKVNANGNVFQFKPINPAILSTLSAGHAVYANFTNHQVSLDGRTTCCTIIREGPISGSITAGLSGQESVAPSAGPDDAPACCVVTGVNLITGVISGRDLKTGYTFKFVAIGSRGLGAGGMTSSDSSKFVGHATVGQKVWADLEGKGVKMSAGVRDVCCRIIEESDH